VPRKNYLALTWEEAGSYLSTTTDPRMSSISQMISSKQPLLLG
jgi:hypothetical protein